MRLLICQIFYLFIYRSHIRKICIPKAVRRTADPTSGLGAVPLAVPRGNPSGRAVPALPIPLNMAIHEIL